MVTLDKMDNMAAKVILDFWGLELLDMAEEVFVELWVVLEVQVGEE